MINIHNALKASKIFKANPNKAKILAEVDKPENIELKQQLEEYLDDEFIALNRENILDQMRKENPDLEEPDAVEDEPAANPEPTVSRPTGSPSGPASFIPNDNMMDKHGDDLAALEDEAPVLETEPTEEDANASTKPKAAEPVTADTLVNPFVDFYATLKGIASEIKGTLNVRSETAGVNRVQLKNDELWIYYNDDINLNNVMGNVIDLLGAANYDYLTFNRLARTDNAIVFEIMSENTAGGVAGVTISNEK